MASHRNSSPRPSGSKPGDWESCTIPHSELTSLQANGFLPQAYMASVRAGLVTYKGGKQAEGTPNPSKGERVCFVPYLLRGLGFPIHPFLRGLLEFYGLQLHDLTPGSVLHIAGFVALCELFLGIEAHFTLWKRLFCLVPRSQGGVHISSGRRRNMAHRRDWISVRNPKEGVRGLAFRMVLYRRRRIAGPYPGRPP